MVTPAMFVIAWVSPNLPRAVLTEEEKLPALSYHGISLGQADQGFAWTFAQSNSVFECKALSRSEFLRSAGSRGLIRDSLQLRRTDAHERMVHRLINIVPSEAAAERVFSALKKNVDRFRTQSSPEAAVAQVLFRSASMYIAQCMIDD